MYCGKCGKQCEDNSKFCDGCGTSFGTNNDRVNHIQVEIKNEADDGKSDKSYGVALLLCFFLGGLGIHRFYLGRNATGAIMLVLTIVGSFTTALIIGFIPLIIVGLWDLIDFFRLLFNGLSDGQGRKLR